MQQTIFVDLDNLEGEVLGLFTGKPFRHFLSPLYNLSRDIFQFNHV